MSDRARQKARFIAILQAAESDDETAQIFWIAAAVDLYD
jgi:hypothetical protein